MEDIRSWKEKFEICVYAKKLLDKLEYLNTKVENLNSIDILEIKKGIYYALNTVHKCVSQAILIIRTRLK